MASIAWIDIETTGLDPYKDPILELAIIVTTERRFTEIARQEWFIQPRKLDEAIARIEGNERVLQMHTDNGLLEKIKAGEGQSKEEVASEAVEFLARSSAIRGLIPMGGSGTERFETKFFAAQMPKLEAALHFWGYDIGSVRRFARLAGIKPPESVSVAKTGTHRAMSDVEQHIAESTWFMRLFAMAKQEGVYDALLREDSDV